MKLTILGSGGIAPIPKPLCQCAICRQARKKGLPYSRVGPSAFIHDINLLIDTPLQLSAAINNVNLKQIDYLLYTHLDPDHFDGVNTILSLYFDGTKYLNKPQKPIKLLIPSKLKEQFKKISSQYGSTYDFLIRSGALKEKILDKPTRIKNILIVPIFVKDNPAVPYIYSFIARSGKKLLYAPCDTKPFPLSSRYVYKPDVFITQPGFFENGLKDDFIYPKNDYTRVELYSFDETLDLSKKIGARKTVFMHLEEYWNRSYDDYKKLEKKYPGSQFSYDGMDVNV